MGNILFLQQNIIAFCVAIRKKKSIFDRILNFVEQRQKQPPEVFYKKGVLKIFANFTGKHL